MANKKRKSPNRNAPVTTVVAMSASDGRRSPSMKEVLYYEQGGKCYLCGRLMTTVDDGTGRHATIDHVWPKSRVVTSKSNRLCLRLACFRCNSNKSNRSYTEMLIGSCDQPPGI